MIRIGHFDFGIGHYETVTDQKSETRKISVAPMKKAGGKEVALGNANIVNPDEIIPMGEEDFKDF